MTSRTPFLSRLKLFCNPSEIWQTLSYQQWDSIYNKLRLVQAQGLECAPIGQSLIPSKYPVILKPIISTATSRQKYRVCMNTLDYQLLVDSGQFAGWFWMPYLDSEQQRCVELIIHNGRPVFEYSLDYHTNQDMTGAISHIGLNISTHGKITHSNIPGWTDILAPALKGYTGPLSIYYIGSYVISIAARWTIWSEYIWQSSSLAPVLDQICRLLNTYTQTADQDTTGVCLDLFRQGLSGKIVSLVPLYLKSPDNLRVAQKHWQTICNSLGITIHWQPGEPRTDEFMPLVATITVFSAEQLKKINKYKQISQLAAPEQNIPVVY